jgi:hypothetical protein
MIKEEELKKIKNKITSPNNEISLENAIKMKPVNFYKKVSEEKNQNDIKRKSSGNKIESSENEGELGENEEIKL